MSLHELAGKPAPQESLTNIPRLLTAYYAFQPDANEKKQLVSFGTSGHRGTSFDLTFNENHILAITQAVCEYRKAAGITGPLYLGMDTHALSEAAQTTAIEVLAANEIQTIIQSDGGYTPTPVISHAILTHNKKYKENQSDGIVITPSHNPPGDGGLKYNPPSGGPASKSITTIIQNRANEILKSNLNSVKRTIYQKAIKSVWIQQTDFRNAYINDLKSVINLDRISAESVKIGIDPMGGAGIEYWDLIADEYGLDLNVVNDKIDPTFSFMHLDRDGQIRMDCSSPYAMAGLIELKDNFDIAFGNDPDFDRHGIVTAKTGLMKPNHFLATSIWYLFQNRPDWSPTANIGKTLVSSAMIDRIAPSLNRKVIEVPVGFKWFVPGLLESSIAFGGEESAGASFSRKNGEVWTTDKDGFIMDLLAAEILAVTGRDPGEIYQSLENKFGTSYYDRFQAPATLEQKIILASLSPQQVKASYLAGEKIIQVLSHAPGNDAPIGGIKVVTKNGWFAARPSGTESIYKIYCESFKSQEHLNQIIEESQSIVNNSLNAI